MELDGTGSRRIDGTGSRGIDDVIDDPDWLCDILDTDDEAVEGAKQTILGGTFFWFLSVVRRTLCCMLRSSISSRENPAYCIASLTLMGTFAASMMIAALCAFCSVSSDMFRLDPHIGVQALLRLRSSTSGVTRGIRNLRPKQGGKLFARFS
jgi:hypothetical protein